MRVAVVGGGWAGIAAAVELTASGVATTLFEAGRVLGGRARSVTVDGRTLDNGQHILLGAYHDTLALMRRVGADPERLLDRQPLRVIDAKGFHLELPKWPAPLNVAWGLLSARGAGLSDKLSTARWMQRLRARCFRLEKDCTVSEWLDAAGQNGRLRKHLWEPLCLAAMNIPADRASAQLFANVLRDSLGSGKAGDTDLLLPSVELGKLLPEPAACWLKAHGATLCFGERIGTLTPTDAGCKIDGQFFDAIILATGPQHAKLLLPTLPINSDFEPIATVYLAYPAEIRLAFPLFNMLGKYGQWVVDRSNGLLACVLSGHGDWETLTNEMLAAALADELQLGIPRWYKVIREKRATFSARVNLSRINWQTAYPHLLIAGDHTWVDYPATLEGAVRSGLRAARHLLKRASPMKRSAPAA